MSKRIETDISVLHQRWRWAHSAAALEGEAPNHCLRRLRADVVSVTERRAVRSSSRPTRH